MLPAPVARFAVPCSEARVALRTHGLRDAVLAAPIRCAGLRWLAAVRRWLHRIALRTHRLRKPVLLAPVALTLEALHKARVAHGAHGLWDAVAATPVSCIPPRWAAGFGRGLHRIADRTHRLRKPMLLTPVALALETVREGRVAHRAHGLGDAVTATPIARGRYPRRARLALSRWVMGLLVGSACWGRRRSGIALLARRGRHEEPGKQKEEEQKVGVLHGDTSWAGHSSVPTSPSRVAAVS